MKFLPLLGRVPYALIFIAAAPRHFTQEGISHAADLGVPLAQLAVPLSGLIALAGGLSILLGFHAKYGAWLIVVFLLPVTFMMHAFWTQIDPTQQHVQQAMFAKNLALLGSAFLIAYFGSGPLSMRE